LGRLPGDKKPVEEEKNGGRKRISSRRLKVAFWLADSRHVNPELEDILAETGTRDISTAEKIILNQLEKDGLSKLYNEMEMPLSAILSEMERRGIYLDTGYLKNLSKDYHAKLEELGKEYIKSAGEKFNVGSPAQLSKILFEKLGIKTAGLKKNVNRKTFDELFRTGKTGGPAPDIKDIFPIANFQSSFQPT